MHPRLGRRVSKDERDRNFLLPPRRLEAKAITAKTWWAPKPLDQGQTSMCVSYSGTLYLLAAPVRNKPPEPPEGLYAECQLIDEWADQQPHDGTSVRALMKVLKAKGTVSEYRWAFQCEAVIDHLLTVGPVVVGTNWYGDMFEPVKGYLKVSGENVGGHAWTLIGANRKRKNPDGSIGAVRMQNSWGDTWGEKGRAWVAFKDLDRLISEDGECAVATEVRAA